MRILLAMRSLEQAEGGPITAAFGLSRALQRRGHSVQITAHDDGAHDASTRVVDADVDVRFFPRTTRVWEFSAEYARWLRLHVRDFDLVIINSLWIGHVHFAASAARRAGVPYVIRTHGCLNPADMSHNLTMKRIYWALEDKKNCSRALFIHSTSEQETGYIRAMGITNIETIPLGIDASKFELQPTVRDRTSVLFVGRIAKKKGIDILIEALAAPELSSEKYSLNILGVDHRGLQEGLEQLATDLGVRDRVHFRGHADEELRAEYLAKSGLFALPSSDENFGIAVAEAMASSLPVLVSPGVSHAAMLTSRSAGVVVERDVREVARGIASIAAMSDSDYAALAQRGRQAVEDLFSWDSVAERFEERVSARISERSKASAPAH